MGEQPSHQNIANYLVTAQSEYPDETAIISAKTGQFKPRSFKQLHREVILCSIYFKSKGISKGDSVLLAVKPGYQLILIAFALFHLGAVPVIIDPGMGTKAFLKCVQNTRPIALVGIPLIHILSKLFPRAFRSVKKTVSVNQNTFISKIDQGKLEPIENPAPSSSDELAAIVFTSGSTGTPKGVCYTHQIFNAQIAHLKTDFGLTKGENDLATLPIFALFNPALGITSVIPEMNPRKPALADPQKLVQTMQQFEINTAFASPIIGGKICSFCESNNISLPHIKRLLLAGAPTNPILIKNLSKFIPNGQVILPYGATEALPLSAVNHSQVGQLEDSINSGKGACLGKPLNGNTIKIMPISMSPFESGENCPKELKQGEIGEICASGAVVSKTYYRMPGATCDSKFNDEKNYYHRMGDLGYYDENGLLRFMGRKVERVLTKDGPLETERCEPIVNAMKNVFRSALIGIGRGRIKEPCLVVELNRGNTISFKILKENILKELKLHLPEFSFRFVVVEKCLPVDSRHNAKIHRLSLAKKWTKKMENQPSLFPKV